jgi:M6 family metalloprotease-like protein
MKRLLTPAVWAACIALSTGMLAAQPAPRASLAAQVRTATNALLTTHAEARRGNGPAPAALRTRAAQQLQSRFSALLQLMQADPAEALSQSLSPEAVQDINSTFPGNARYLEVHGRWEGPVEKSVIDAADNTSRVEYGLSIGAQHYTVHLAGADIDSNCRDVIAFQGILLGEVIAAADGTVTSSATAAATSPCGPRGAQNVAVIYFDFPSYPAPSNVTPQGIKDIMMASSGRSVDDFWRKASYNQAFVGATDVYGTYRLDQDYTCANYTSMRAAAIAKADPDINFTNYNRVYLIFPNPGGCDFAGRANVGCTSLSTQDGTIVASSAWMLANYFSNRDQGVKLTLHEGGHNLGLMHSRSRAFGTEPLGGLGVAGTLSEYGDINSTMGSWNFGHYPGSQKLSLGWQTASNTLTVQSNGSYSLLPTEISTSGLQTLKVKRGTDNSTNAWLWVEYRQPLDVYDNTLNAQIFTGALIHYQDSTTGTYTDLLDFTRSNTSFADAALAKGQTWVDPYSNLSISVTDATANALTVNVNYGPIPCVRNAPTLSASPTNPSAYPGTNVNYTLSITNNDSLGCAASTFNLASTLPSGFATAFSIAAVALNPGQSTSVTMTKSVPANATPASYPVDATASSVDSTRTATANLTVIAPPPPLSVTTTTNSGTYAPRSHRDDDGEGTQRHQPRFRSQRRIHADRSQRNKDHQVCDHQLYRCSYLVPQAGS